MWAVVVDFVVAFVAQFHLIVIVVIVGAVHVIVCRFWFGIGPGSSKETRLRLTTFSN